MSSLLVLGSGLRPAGTERSASGPTLISEMEAVLKSLDRRVETLDQRVGRIEQILPTLATKADLDATRDELRDELRAEIRSESRGLRVLIEDSRGDTRLLAEHMSSLMNQMNDVIQRLDRIERR
jgi:chromosome segregation ATPase